MIGFRLKSGLIGVGLPRAKKVLGCTGLDPESDVKVRIRVRVRVRVEVRVRASAGAGLGLR
eukprot:800084-Pleurochrysis_carterae.AAC.1